MVLDRSHPRIANSEEAEGRGGQRLGGAGAGASRNRDGEAEPLERLEEEIGARDVREEKVARDDVGVVLFLEGNEMTVGDDVGRHANGEERRAGKSERGIGDVVEQV